MLKTSTRGEPIASEVFQAVNRSAALFILVTIPVVSVVITASPMDCMVTRRFISSFRDFLALSKAHIVVIIRAVIIMGNIMNPSICAWKKESVAGVIVDTYSFSGVSGAHAREKVIL